MSNTPKPITIRSVGSDEDDSDIDLGFEQEEFESQPLPRLPLLERQLTQGKLLRKLCF